METKTKNCYKIWRNKKGRSMKRWLTDEKVTYYKSLYPEWRIKVVSTGYKEETQTRSDNNWGLDTRELFESKKRRMDKTQPTINPDDVLDFMLAIEKGI